MTEINVMIPISLLEGTDLGDAQSIADALSKATEVHATLPALQASQRAAIAKVKEIGSYLAQLLNEPASSMSRAQKLRQLVVDCQTYGG
jgi:hypothetical protein